MTQQCPLGKKKKRKKKTFRKLFIFFQYFALGYSEFCSRIPFKHIFEYMGNNKASLIKSEATDVGWCESMVQAEEY
jgi:hypothetical protein